MGTNIVLKNSEDIQCEFKTEQPVISLKQFAFTLNVDESTIRKATRELYPDKMKNGIATYYNEEEVTEIKKYIHSPVIVRLGRSSEVTTEIEMSEMAVRVISHYTDKARKLAEENQELKSTVKLLVHDVAKSFTASEMSAELQLRSPQVFNKILKDKGIQYKVNNTWKLTAKYSENEYTITKDYIAENGYLVHDMRWTGKGRLFLLELFEKNLNQHN
jgi:hypothetical protein